MRASLLIIVLIFSNAFSQAQSESNIVLLTIKNDRLELANAISFLNANDPRLVCVNVDLFECDQRRPRDPSLNREDHFDSLAKRSVTYPSEAEKQLSRELIAARSLLMPSKVSSFLGAESDFIGCGFLYPERVKTGFINLIGSENVSNQIEKFQVSLIDIFTKDESYHFAVNIALAVNAEKTNAFIQSHENIVQIDFARKRKFDTYSFDDFVNNKISPKALNGKVVIIAVGQPADYFLIRKKENNNEELRRMSTSEIFANIACQIIGE
jgi:hypothetical protein